MRNMMQKEQSGLRPDPEAPAAERQKLLLKTVIRRDWLHPNPFESGNYKKWETLTVGEADELLASIPPERLGALEKEATEKQNAHGARQLAERIGRSVEEIVREIGREIDGGF